ncbi:MAG: hypothetical protein VX546_02960 [Myxococcota bacterium]|nr:hypothetical protein [Myxococcota bacterium]
MARNKIPDPLSRRHLLEGELPEARALAIGQAYLAEGRTVEALDFLARAEAAEELAALRVEAVAAGDLFLFRAIARAAGDAPTHEEWVAVAAAAEAAGMERYAQDARRQVERGEE